LDAAQQIDATAREVASATSWDERVALIRRVPESFGTGQLAAVYAAIAERAYAPDFGADFGYVHWPREYELDGVIESYNIALRATSGFQAVSPADLARVLQTNPRTLRIFRLLLGFTTQEFAAATVMVARGHGGPGLANTRIKSMETGHAASPQQTELAALTIDHTMTGSLFSETDSETIRSKITKPDTALGWASVQHYAVAGVPLPMFLHQRLYGGAFRQILDATSTRRGDLIEDEVESRFVNTGILHVRTGSANQSEIEARFGLTVRPAPDFVVYDVAGHLQALLECKGANDGGTARDKASRFRALRGEATRLGGVPLFAVLAGLGWRRTADALGPVVRDTDGRVFTPSNLDAMLACRPFPELAGSAMAGIVDSG